MAPDACNAPVSYTHLDVYKRQSSVRGHLICQAVKKSGFASSVSAQEAVYFAFFKGKGAVPEHLLVAIGFSYVFQLQIHAFSPFHLAGHKKAWPVFPEERGLCLCVPCLLYTSVMAIAFGFSGFYFVNYVFETALDREVGQALDENSILRFAFETAALNVPAKYDVLQDHTIEQIASNMETGGHDSSRLLRLSDEEKNVLYISSGFEADNGLLGLSLIHI